MCFSMTWFSKSVTLQQWKGMQNLYFNCWICFVVIIVVNTHIPIFILNNSLSSYLNLNFHSSIYYLNLRYIFYSPSSFFLVMNVVDLIYIRCLRKLQSILSCKTFTLKF